MNDQPSLWRDQLLGGRGGVDLPIIGWLKLWAALTLAFALYFSGGSLLRLRFPSEIVCVDTPALVWICWGFIEKLWVAALVGGLSLGLLAWLRWRALRNYQLSVRVIASTPALIVPALLACTGLFVSAPVMTWPDAALTRQQHGRIALAGPLLHFALALVCFAGLSMIILWHLVVPSWLALLGYAGFRFNALLGLCSLLPIHPWDGARLLAWQPLLFGGLLAVGLILSFVLGNELVLQWLLQLFLGH